MSDGERTKVFEVNTKNVQRSEAPNGVVNLAFAGQAATVMMGETTVRPHVMLPVRLDGYSGRDDGDADGRPAHYATLMLERDRLIALAMVALAAVRELDALAADEAGYANAWDDPNSYQNERR